MAVPINGSFIIDDQINEPQREGLILVLEIISADDDVELDEASEVLFIIFDNDGTLPYCMISVKMSIMFAFFCLIDILLGFDQTTFVFNESAGVLTDEFVIIKVNNTQSDQNISITVRITSSGINPATPGR